MSSEILVTPQELRDHAAAIKTQSGDTTDQFTAMKSRLEQLQSQFRGQAATAFDERWQEWHTHATGLIEALDGLGQFLNDAAQAVEDLDTQLAQGLKG